MTDNPFWLAMGAFLTSSGVGGLAALVAAVLAYKGIARRITFDRQQDRVADARERWWAAYTHLWANQSTIPVEALTEGVASLEKLAETEQQSMMVDLFYDTLAKDIEEAT